MGFVKSEPETPPVAIGTPENGWLFFIVLKTL